MQVTYSHEAELKSDLYLYLSNHQWTFHFSICQKLERLFVSSQFLVALNLSSSRVVCWRESVVSFGGPSFDDSLYYLSLFVGCVAGVDVDGG